MSTVHGMDAILFPLEIPACGFLRPWKEMASSGSTKFENKAPAALEIGFSLWDKYTCHKHANTAANFVNDKIGIFLLPSQEINQSLKMKLLECLMTVLNCWNTPHCHETNFSPPSHLDSQIFRARRRSGDGLSFVGEKTEAERSLASFWWVKIKAGTLESWRQTSPG